MAGKLQPGPAPVVRDRLRDRAGRSDVTAALDYLAGLAVAGLGSGTVNPVDMASLLPGGFAQPSAPSPADAVALQEYLAGLRDSSLNVPVAVGIENPATSGFTLALSPAVPGLTASNLNLSGGARVGSLSSDDGGATYAVQASLTAGQIYDLGVADAGYRFSPSPATVRVPQAQTVTATVYADVYNVTSSGTFTLLVSPAVALSASDLTFSPVATISTFSAADGGAQYSVGGLAAGTTYSLTLHKSGFTFVGSPLTVAVPQTVATAVYATVGGVSVGGFTLGLAPDPGPGAVTGMTLMLTEVGNASVTVTATVGPSVGAGQYSVTTASGLAPGVRYTFTPVLAGYAFSAATVDVPAESVATAVYSPATGGFTLASTPPATTPRRWPITSRMSSTRGRPRR